MLIVGCRYPGNEFDLNKNTSQIIEMSINKAIESNSLIFKYPLSPDQFVKTGKSYDQRPAIYVHKNLFQPSEEYEKFILRSVSSIKLSRIELDNYMVNEDVFGSYNGRLIIYNTRAELENSKHVYPLISFSIPLNIKIRDQIIWAIIIKSVSKEDYRENYETYLFKEKNGQFSFMNKI